VQGYSLDTTFGVRGCGFAVARTSLESSRELHRERYDRFAAVLFVAAETAPYKALPSRSCDSPTRTRGMVRGAQHDGENDKK